MKHEAPQEEHKTTVETPKKEPKKVEEHKVEPAKEDPKPEIKKEEVNVESKPEVAALIKEEAPKE